MKESRFIKIGIILLIVLLTVDIGSRILLHPVETIAAEEKVQYKLVSLDVRSDAGVEKPLNNMASQGWKLHTIIVVPLGVAEAVFEK